MAGAPSLSRDGRGIALWVTRNDENFIRIGDREEGPFDWVVNPAVSGDGSTIAYAYEENGAWFLRVAGKRTPLAAKVGSIFISPDGKEVGCVEQTTLPSGGSKMRVRALGKTGEEFSLIGTPLFSPTEQQVVYGAENETKRFVVIGAKKIETPDRVSDPVFSSDGRKVGYGARIGRELWWKVIETR